MGSRGEEKSDSRARLVTIGHHEGLVHTFRTMALHLSAIRITVTVHTNGCNERERVRRRSEFPSPSTYVGEEPVCSNRTC